VTITADCTRAELEEAMTHVLATLRRMPSHWTDKRAALHGELDELLTQHEALGKTDGVDTGTTYRADVPLLN